MTASMLGSDWNGSPTLCIAALDERVRLHGGRSVDFFATATTIRSDHALVGIQPELGRTATTGE